MKRNHSKRISVKEYSELITQKVREVIEQDRFKAFLLSPDTIHAFRDEVLGLEPYSFNNRMILGLFGARAVAGFKAWQTLGYFVRKGGKGIPIYRPVIVNKEPEANDDQAKTPLHGEEESADKPGKTLVGFDVTHVFDISQVEEKDGPGNEKRRQKVKDFFTRMEAGNNFCRELTGGPLYIAQELQSWVETEYIVRFEDIAGGSKGFTNGKEIVVRQGMSPAQTIKTLLHEHAHCRLGHHGSDLSATAREIQAESAAFVAAHALGLDTGSYSFDYLAAWGVEVLKADNGVAEFRSIIETAIEQGNNMAQEFKVHLDRFMPTAVPEDMEAAA